MKLPRTLVCLSAAAIACGYANRFVDARELQPAVSTRFLTTENTIDDWPCFSPDGQSILFSRSVDEGKTWDFFVVPAGGGTARRFMQSPLQLSVSATRASWSKFDGTIAFTGGSPQGTGALWFVDASGVNAYPDESSSGLSQIYYPSWLSKHSVVVMDAKDLVLRIIDVQERTAKAITQRNQVLTGRPSVSADGKNIAFAGQRNAGQSYDQEKNSIWLMDFRHEPRLLEKTPLQGRSPDWSPDGKQLTFESNRSDGHHYAVFVIHADGAGLRQMTEGNLNAYHPAWSPNGKQIVFAERKDESPNVVNLVIIDAR